MEDTLRLSWEDVRRLAGDVAAAVKKSGMRPECLIGITSGGLVPLRLVAGHFDAREILTVSARSYDGGEQGDIAVTNVPPINLRGRPTLLVDEIADSGNTLARVGELLRRDCGADDVKTATLVVRSDKCAVRPDYWALEADRWVVFPWE